MPKTARQEGKVLRLTAPAGGVEADSGYIIGSMFVVALIDADAGEPFEGATVQVWELPKNPSDVVTQLATAYWDATNNRTTITSSGNTKIGVFTEPAANATTTAFVRLDGVSIS